jgi:hypothetical protein
VTERLASDSHGLLQLPASAVAADRSVAIAYPVEHPVTGDPVPERLAFRVRHPDGIWTPAQVATTNLSLFTPHQLIATSTGFEAMWQTQAINGADGHIATAVYTTATNSWTFPVGTGPGPIRRIVGALLAPTGAIAVLTEHQTGPPGDKRVTSAIQVRNPAGLWQKPLRLSQGVVYPVFAQPLAFSGSRFAAIGCVSSAVNRCHDLRFVVVTGTRLRRQVRIRLPRGLVVDGFSDRASITATANGRFLIAYSAGRTRTPSTNNRQLRALTLGPTATAAPGSTLLGRYAMTRAINVATGPHGAALVAVSAIRYGCAVRYIAAAERRNGTWSPIRRLACEPRQPFGYAVEVASTRRGFIAAWSHLRRGATVAREGWLNVAATR